MTIKGDFFSDDKKKSRYYTDCLYEFFSSSEESKSQDPEKFLLDFFSFIEKICTSKIRRRIFVHLLVARASCALALQRKLGVRQASMYRELKTLLELGLVEKVIPIRNGVGRPYAIYAIKNHRPEDIVKALENASRQRIPAYSSAQKITQLILEEYLEPRGLNEISWRDILSISRGRCTGFHSIDIARLVARELNHEGIKVWM